MWVQSSDDEAGPIYCDSCRRMIDEEDYSNHWPACRKQVEKPKPIVPSKKEEKKGEVKDEKGETESYDCPACGCNVPLDKIEEHIASCGQLQVECAYCNASFPALEIEDHENSCESNDSVGERNNQLLTLLQLMGNNANNGNGNRNSNAGNGGSNNGNNNVNVNLLAALLAARGVGGLGLGQGQRQRQGQGQGQTNSTEQLLHESLFPALRKMENGMKKRQLSQFPTEQYSKAGHEETMCSICQEDFEQGEEVMKIGCSHIHHALCYKDWLQHSNTCPLCKTVIKARPKETK